MNSQIKVLIENYDRNLKKYLLANQEICNVSVNELKQILEDIQDIPKVEISFPPRVITSDYIFVKIGDEMVYRGNYRYTFAGFPVKLLNDPQKLDISKLNDIFTSKQWSRKLNWFMDRLFIPMVIFSAFLYFTITSLFEIKTPTYYILLVWGNALAIFCLLYLPFSKIQEIPIRYSYPFKYNFQPVILSYAILIFSNYELLFILSFFDELRLTEVLTESLIWLMGMMIIFGVLGIFFIIYTPYRAKGNKEDLLNDLYRLMKSLPLDQKTYLSQFAAKAEDSKSTTTGLLSKYIAFFSLLISIIPLFIPI